MGKYHVHRNDGNADLLIDAMVRAGASVERLGRPLDCLVSIDGVAGLAELKTPTGELRDSQRQFIARYQGPVALLRTVEEAFAFVRELRAFSCQTTRITVNVWRENALAVRDKRPRKRAVR